jgi:hypothetical protein
MDDTAILTVEPRKWCHIIEYILFSYVIGLLLCIIFLTVTIINSFIKLAFHFNVFFCLINIEILIVLGLIGLSLFFNIKSLKIVRSLFKTKINFYDNYIEFTNNKGFQHIINNSEMSYIFAWQRKITIIFQNEKLFFFDFRKSTYGAKSLKDIDEYFKKSDKYLNDYKTIQKTIKDNKLRTLLFSTQHSFIPIIARNQRNLR